MSFEQPPVHLIAAVVYKQKILGEILKNKKKRNPAKNSGKILKQV